MQNAETILAIYKERGKELSDLKVKGRKEKPLWLKTMAAMKRKTLAVCEYCHHAIHAGKPTRTHEIPERSI
jgi:hypothetical protein